eukprot:5458_1
MAYDSASRARVKRVTKKQQETALKRQRQKTTNTIRLFYSTGSYFEGIQKGKYYMIGTIHTEGQKEYGDMLYDDYQMRANEWYIIDVDNKHMDTKNNYEYNSIKTQLDACNAKVKSLSMGFTIKVVHKNDKKFKKLLKQQYKAEKQAKKLERERLKREKLERERLEAERLKRLERENQIKLEIERQQRLEKERLERERERQAILKKEQEKK